MEHSRREGGDDPLVTHTAPWAFFFALASALVLASGITRNGRGSNDPADERWRMQEFCLDLGAAVAGGVSAACAAKNGIDRIALATALSTTTIAAIRASGNWIQDRRIRKKTESTG